MARGSHTGNRALVKDASAALDQFKYEVAREIKIQIPADHYWGNIPARQCGAVGGHMVKKMVEMAEESLANQTRSSGRRGR